MPDIEPTGLQHEVAVDEMFFSTTDARGVIGQSNSVFVRLSRFPHEQLEGAPHNIIRHPGMPGGAFHAMWQTLESGAPFVAYVHNLAADGSRYDVLATVTPLPSGGYLSVRTRPVREDLAAAAASVYAKTSQEEARLRGLGMNRRQAASAGSLHIMGQLAGLGFDDYTAFQRVVLPAEVARRDELAQGLPERPYAAGPLRQALDAALQLHKGLGAWMAEQDALAGVSRGLQEAAQGISQEFASVSVTSTAIADASAAGGQGQDYLLPLQVWSEMQSLVGNQLGRLRDELIALDSNIAETRFRIALARLQSTMLSNFVAEIIDGGPDSQRATSAICVLTEAVRDGVTTMSRYADEHRKLSERVAHLIERTTSMTSIPRQLLMHWQSASQGVQLPAAVADLIPRISASIEHGGEALSRLERLAQQCRAMSDLHDATLLLESLDEVDRGAGCPPAPAGF